MTQTHCSTYYQLKKSRARITVFQGGSRSGKSYSICEGLIEFCYENRNCHCVVTIARKTLPTCKGTIMRDFFEILRKEGLYKEKDHNKTENTYELYGNTVEFLSADDAQKIRGRKRAVLFLNEANEFTYEDFMQFAIRTTEKIIMDYNPSMLDHWIYDRILTRNDVDFFQSTYHDNPFLEQYIIDEIENLKYIDINAYNVYALGMRGVTAGVIFTNWEIGDFFDLHFGYMDAGDEYYGLDFGFTNDPTALVWHRDVNTPLRPCTYMRELIYETGMLNSDIIESLRMHGVRKTVPIYADASEPKSIEEIRRAGFNIRAAIKGKDSVRKGINVMKQRRMIVHPDSTNLIKELRHYKWEKNKDGKLINEPVDIYNHAIDASRYAQSSRKRTRIVVGASDDVVVSGTTYADIERAIRGDKDSEEYKRFWRMLNQD